MIDSIEHTGPVTRVMVTPDETEEAAIETARDAMGGADYAWSAVTEYGTEVVFEREADR